MSSRKIDYSEYSKEELIAEINELKKRKKYGLVWDEEREPEKVILQCKKELPVLKEVKSKSIQNDPNKPTHILIEGDNFHALSVLNYTHQNAIDVIYIDPPYNTGAKDWKYNNNFVDGEDSYRHSKWLSFMKNRLEISKNVLKEEGIICVTIDDYEMPKLWMLMEEIFGEYNFLGTVAIRINPGGRKSKRKIAAQHEYALFFSKTKITSVAKITKDPSEKSHSYKKDNNGKWFEERNLRKEGADSLAKKDSKRYYPIYFDPKTGGISTKEKLPIEIQPIDTKGQKRIWRRGIEAIDEMYKDKKLIYKKTKYGDQIYFKFEGGLTGETPKSFWEDAKYSASEHGTQTLDKILGIRESFNFPKSPYATSDCIQVASSNKNAIILDFFAGSGTTGQSVLELNQLDKGKRQFILCTNNENNISTEVCHPRLKKVIEGYKDLDGIKVDGLGGNLKYFKTTFVPAKSTDRNKEKLTKQSVEMLCLKENTFESVLDSDKIKIFKNNDHYTGILFDESEIQNFREQIEDYDLPISVYIFSLGDDDFAEEFFDIKDKVKVSSIPAAILRVYKRIFK